jgi:4-hydroxy-3-polyprenylbenzoate decarboxylase
VPFQNLNSFLKFLEEKGDLHRIKAEVDPILEITEIATRVVKKKGPALLFENVKGSKFPLVINILGAERRIEWALGRTPAQVGNELAGMAHSLMPPTPAKLWEQRAAIKRVLAMRPKPTFFPPIKSNKIQPANLSVLPVAQSWPLDGGRFITFPLVVTKSPKDGKQNMGVYRMHVYNNTETGMHWQIGKGGGYHYQQAEENGKDLPLAVVLGADPILMMCGVLPLPEGLDETVFAGYLRGSPTRTTTVSDGHLRVPAEAEFILEGVVPPMERRLEGPYGDHFGHYSLAAQFPIFKINRIYHRDGAVFPIAVVGKPPQEDQVIGDAVQEMLLPLLKVMHPEVVDLWAYQEAGFHNLLVISVKERFEKEAVKTALWALGEGQLALSKCVIVVGPDVNARDFHAVLKAIRENFDPKEDFFLLPATSQDTLDFTSFKMNLGSKMILDASRRDRMRMRDPHAAVEIDLSYLKTVDNRIKDAILLDETMLVLQVESQGRAVLEKMLALPGLDDISLVVAVSPDVPLNDRVLLLWGLFTRFDCARDTFFKDVAIKNGHPVYDGPLFIDATWKDGYPAPLTMTDEIVRKVNSRWAEYGLEKYAD